MNRILLSLALLSTLAIGCGRASTAIPASSSSSKMAHAKISDSVTSLKDPPFDPPMGPDEIVPIASLMPAKAAAVAPLRAPGDFVVHRFSGSFRDTPLTLTQRVVGREGNVLTVDMTFEEGSSKKTVRVKMDDSPEKRGEVLAVALMDKGREVKAPLSVYEELMEKTAVAADQNEEDLGSENLSVDIAGHTVSAKKSSFRVRLGKIQATLRTVQSEMFAWGDLSGEITSQSGDVIYRAELVDSGHGDGKGQAVAATEESEDVYDDE